MAPEADPEALLVEDMARFTHDPLGWVVYAFEWGKGELAGEAGPRTWQREVLGELGSALRAGRDVGPILQAVASGHGIGKSALVSWLILWGLSTHEDTKIVVTANTDAQLRTKTWPEVAKWHRLLICSHWFRFVATSLHAVDPAHEKTWRADAIPWSEHNTEAFAGLHNKGRRLMLVFDEASAIADRVWEVAEGALTDTGTEIFWLAFGNPTKNTGRFRECFGRLAHRWRHRQIDSRTVDGTNRTQLDAWVADYGEDSDFVRVRVKGQFPRAGSIQFISSEVVAQAAKREAVASLADPLVMGIDVARFGDDESSIRFRRGRDARTIPAITLRGVDTMTLAGRVAQLIDLHHPDAVFVDETGVGGGVVDRLRQLGYQVMGINNGSVSDTPVEGELVANKGAECWARMRQWLPGGAIDDDPELIAQLESREYGFNAHNQVVLEKKSDLKKRGLSSPDRADGLALTFAYPVAPRVDGRGHAAPSRTASDYDPLA